jgi:hypothetical protein
MDDLKGVMLIGLIMMITPIYPINGLGGIILFASALWWIITKWFGD